MASRTIVITPNAVTAWGPKVVYALRKPESRRGGRTLYWTDYRNEYAEKGYWGPVSFRMYGPMTVLQEMAENGLSRDVKIWGPGLEPEFQGMVYEIGFIRDEDRLDRRLDTMANSAFMRADTDGDGTPERSTPIENEDSQDRFGTKEQVLLGGELSSSAVADQAIQKWINYKAFPLPEPRIGGGDRPGESYLEIFCRPYSDTLGWRVYNNAGASGDQNMSQQVLDMIGERADVTIKAPSTWNGTLDADEGRPTDADALSPDWDHTVLEGVSGADSETDTGGSLNDSTANPKFGTTHIRVDFDDSTVAYITKNASAADQTEATIDLWFDPTNVGLQSGKVVQILQLDSGTQNDVVHLDIANNSGTYQVRAIYRLDSGSQVAVGGTFTDISDAYVHLRLVVKFSTGAGNDDGFVYLYIDDGGSITTLSDTGIDNDTHDWDNIDVGMVFTNSTTFGGSFDIDEIRVSESVSPVWITEAAARDGSYGWAFTLEDQTARYIQEASPTDETEFTPELWVDPSLVDMANGDELVIAVWIDAGSAVAVARLVMKDDGTDRLLYTQTRLDGGSYTDGEEVVIPSTHGVRVRVHALLSSGAGNDDGRTYLFVNDRQKDAVTGLDNDTFNIDIRRYGAVSVPDVGTSGVLKMDTMRYSTESLITVTDESGVGEYIRKVTVESNPTPVKKGVDADRFALDQMSSLVDFGDPESNAWLYENLPDRELALIEAAAIEIEES